MPSSDSMIVDVLEPAVKPSPEYHIVHRTACTGDFKVNRESNRKTLSQNLLLVEQTQRHLQTRTVLYKYCNFHLPSCISKLLEIIILNPDDCEIELIYSSVPLSGKE